MKIGEFFRAAFDTLWANRARSVLTMLGIIIGTAAVISIFALGQSASASIARTFGVFGNQGIFLFPDQSSRRFNAVQISWSGNALLRQRPRHPCADFDGSAAGRCGRGVR